MTDERLTGLTADLAHSITALGREPLNTRTQQYVSCALLDHLAVGLFGSKQDAIRRLVAARLAGRAPAGRSPLYGRNDAAPASEAAFMNAAAVHGFELDDLNETGGVHTSCVVISAALSAAAQAGSSGAELVGAIVCGFEAMGEVGAASDSGDTAFHLTGTHGPIGAAAAAARITGLDADGLESAWGLAASFAGGVKAFQSGGGEVKRLHAARGAEAGILAVDLVRHGFPGPTGALEATRGFFAAFGGPGWVRPVRRQDLVVEDTYLKPYSAVAASHPVIDLVLAARAEHGLTADRVATVRVGLPLRRVGQNSNPTPKDTMAVQYSTEATVAIALTGNPHDPQEFEFDRFNAGPARRFLPRVEIYGADEDQLGSSGLAAMVTIQTTDGTVYESAQQSLRMPASLTDRRSAALEKFTTLNPEVEEAALARLVAQVDGLSDLASIDPLLSCLAEISASVARNSDANLTNVKS